MNMKLFGLSYRAKTDKHVLPGSTIKNNPASGRDRIADVALKSRQSLSRSTTSFADCGNREEAFFDSHPWLDSDCEDDFYSVHGDFTPSCGNTPCLSRTTSERIVSTRKDSSPSEKKKKLLELFQDSAQDMCNSDVETKSTVHDFPPKSVDGSGATYVCGSSSVCSSGSGRTGDGDSNVACREKATKSVQCCLPGFSDRRKKARQGCRREELDMMHHRS